MTVEIEVAKNGVCVEYARAGIKSNHLNLNNAFYFVESAMDRRKTPEQICCLIHVAFSLDVKAQKVVYNLRKNTVDVIWLNSFEYKMITKFDLTEKNICYQGVFDDCRE